MSQLLDLRGAIVSTIQTALPPFEVASHLGRFNDEQLRAFMIKAPAVRVALLALEDAKPVPDDGVDYCARIGIYVVTKDGNQKLSREDAAACAVEVILALCDRTRWGLPFAKLSEKAAAQNLFTAETLSMGVALWAIDLRQPIRLSKAQAETGALSTLLLGVAPNIGAGHEADYTVVGSVPSE